MNMDVYFKNFKKYAFRLELLQKYDVEEEKEILDYFFKTGKVKTDDESTQNWFKLIKSKAKIGATMSRVHVIENPISDYLRFELSAQKYSDEAGEKIFILEKNKFDEIADKVGVDYWLFDDEIVLKVNYDKSGKYLGYDEIRDNLEPFIETKNKLLSISVKLTDFNFD